MVKTHERGKKRRQLETVIQREINHDVHDADGLDHDDGDSD